MTQLRHCGMFLFSILLLSVLLSVLVMTPALAEAVKPVVAEFGKESAWTGEAVPLMITLKSEGPFSGTAAFDFPEIPQTALLRVGRPVVGSEVVGGTTYFTQLHEFALFTQQSGELIVPSFRVRFEGKKTFRSDPVPIEGRTAPLRFTSKRPPGTEGLGVVLATPEMEIEQSWAPQSFKNLQAGDVIQRTVIRHAMGTTAMMFSPPKMEATDGVRVYRQDPRIHDENERGEASAERRDTIKYQFEKGGTFTLPELTFTWWDPDERNLRSETLPGKEVTVAAAAVAPLPKAKAKFPLRPIIMASLVGLALWSTRERISNAIVAWRARRVHPEAVAGKELLRACRTSDASAAYAALMRWKRCVEHRNHSGKFHLDFADWEAPELRYEWSALAVYLFDSTPEQSPWSGHDLARAFRQAKRTHSTRVRNGDGNLPLPGLNPTSAPS